MGGGTRGDLMTGGLPEGVPVYNKPVPLAAFKPIVEKICQATVE